jgi:hypothetical protein
MNLPRANGDEYDRRVEPSGTEAIAFAQRGDTTAFEWLVAVFHFFCFSLLGLVLTANHATAQTIGYRQTNLDSNLPNVANNLTPNLVDPWGLPSCQVSLFSLAILRGGKLRNNRASMVAAAASLAIVVLVLAMGGCGGGYGSSTEANRGTASIMVTAQSGNIAHTTAINVTVQ